MQDKYFDELETRDPQARVQAQGAALPDLIRRAQTATGWQQQLGDVEAEAITTPEALASLPVLRKSDLKDLQADNPPFGGFALGDVAGFSRIFMSPGPIFEIQGRETDPYHCARGLFAAGFRPGDIVQNCFAYHMTPGGFVLDTGARALGCAVIPAGVGNTEAQLDVIERARPVAFTGTPDYLKVLLDKAEAAGRDASSIKKALVSGGALFPSLRAEYKARGVDVYQAYATADVGVIAYESEALEGMIVDEGVILEIVKPGTNEPVAPGDVGEVVVTNFSSAYPMIRFGTGDLSAVLPGQSPCGRTNMRIKGWMGRADQTAKIKGMFVHPSQISALEKRHPELGRVRLVVERANEQDVMTLKAECAEQDSGLTTAIAETLQSVTKLRGHVELVAPGSLANDGVVIEDARSYD